MRYRQRISMLALLLIGCGSGESGTGGATATTTGTGGNGGSGNNCTFEVSPDVADVTGRWAYLEVGSQLVQAPGFAEPFHNRIVSVEIFDQMQTGDTLTVNTQYCKHYTEDPDSVVHAIIPDAYTNALVPAMRNGTFAMANGELHYSLPRFYEVVGSTLADPATEALPTDASDPRVIDQDADGLPGMTIHLTGLVDGDLYVTERKWTELNGVATAVDRIEGLLGFNSEQNVLETNPPGLKDTVSASNTFTDPETCNSYFRMARIPDNADCTWVNDQFDTLFP